jgi:hypothetical protein
MRQVVVASSYSLLGRYAGHSCVAALAATLVNLFLLLVAHAVVSVVSPNLPKLAPAEVVRESQ